MPHALHRVFAAGCLLAICSMLPCFAQTDSATLSGRITDTSGAVVTHVQVQATQTETNTTVSMDSNDEGLYVFTNLRPGTYRLSASKPGFRTINKLELVLHVQDAVEQNFTMALGSISESVTVTTGSVHVETENTQMGEVIEGQRITGVPLVTRSYTDLLALQPGVISSSSGMTGGGAGGATGNFIAAGFAVPLVSGSLNAGNLSVNGMREADNGFLLNGATVQEFGFGGTSVIPNLDSIAEFRILTNNFDAEYGNFNGGQINVITKSGSNGLHGNAFEFLRNTNLDAANFFDHGERGAYHQNQFGGTLGGPIKRDKIFFFGDFQGNRVVQGISSGQLTLPSLADRSGDLSDQAGALALAAEKALQGGGQTGTVQGAAWAEALSQRLGYAVTAGEPYYTGPNALNPNRPPCTTVSQCVFPNAVIPSAAFSAPARNLLKYIPAPTSGTTFSTSAFSQRLGDNKTSGRVDYDAGFNRLSGYYFFDNYTMNNPYPTATVPGFDALGTGRTQVINIGDTKTFGPTTVNEVRFEVVRVHDALNKPDGGTGVSLSSLGFTTGANTLGIDPLNPQTEGVPEIDFNSFVIGVPSRVLGLIENTYQGLDNFSKVTGKHTLKFGGSYHYTQLVEQLHNIENGNFQFVGTETGVDFADFLIGAPTRYIQGQAPPSNGRSRYAALYAQDSWHAAPNLTVNYSLRWEFSTPWYEQHNELETLVPGLQSQVFPGAPAGWVFPGDPGIPSTLAPTRYNNFAPRLGIAYSPNAESRLLRKLTGGTGQTSIRAGYALLYSSFEGATDFNEIGDAPYGFYYVSPAPPVFTAPFQDRGTLASEQQRFPVQFPSSNVSASNPDNSVNWSLFTPISSSPGFYYKNRLPYAEHYEFSLQRQFSFGTMASVSYVGTQGHRLPATVESNPGNPALCLMLAQATPQGCGPGLENNVFTLNGQTYNGTRSPFPNTFGSNGYFMTVGQSSYNSFQLNVRHSSGPLQLLAGYTYSRSLDNSSGYGEQINQFNPKTSIALSAFDSTHNFVASYSYQLPFDKLRGSKRLTHGWALSGITRFATGLPVTLYELDDNSLLGTPFAGPLPLGIDTPNYQGGALRLNNPRSGQPFFDTTGFTYENVGQLGNAPRRFFHGPGINNWDVALLKDTELKERMKLQFRAEFFNVFNHTQFGAVNGNINSGLPNFVNGVNQGGTFGMVTSANPPRIGQLSLKLMF